MTTNDPALIQDLNIAPHTNSTPLTWCDNLKPSPLVPNPGRENELLDLSTGTVWLQLNKKQEDLAKLLIAGCSRMDAAERLGIDKNFETRAHLTSYMTHLCQNSSPFRTYCYNLINDAQRLSTVSRDDHIRRLRELSAAAQREGRYAAAIAAEKTVGICAGLYAKNTVTDPDRNADVAATSVEIESRITELLDKLNEKKAKVVSEQ